MNWLTHRAVVLALIIVISSTLSNIYSSHPVETTTTTDGIQFAFLKSHVMYHAQRIVRHYHFDKRSASCSVRLLRVPLTPNRYADNHIISTELKDGVVTANNQAFLRWRLTLRNIWGTERTFDDRCTGIFTARISDLAQLERYQNESDGEGHSLGLNTLSNYFGGNSIVSNLASEYWERKGYLPDSTFRIPGQDGWPTGSDDIYFDFIPSKGDESVLLFMLIKAEQVRSDRQWGSTRQQNVIEVWTCGDDQESLLDYYARWKCWANRGSPKRTPPPHVRSLNNGKAAAPLKSAWISTDISEPFYVFEQNDVYFFVTTSGRIYTARYTSIDPKLLNRLVAELDSEVFEIREKATCELRTIGKPVKPVLEAYLLKSITPEQKSRITRILGEINDFPDRETKLLWQDAKRPVDKLLFDMDKDMVFAFTKPDSDHQVYYFEVVESPRPRLFTGNRNPDGPAEVPVSTRLFLGYARFLKAKK